ncbi:MAG: carboxyltransferase domain-containing protein [Tateyamaria sp.]|jgi:allophanate hydrolase subunit 1|nr:carboxyltransferase domain-containing protein [Tateyamaria sp.]
MSENKSHYPKIRSVGLNGILVTFSDTATDAANRAAIAFRNAVDKLKWPEIAESSSTLVSAFFQIDLAQHNFVVISRKFKDVLGSENWINAELPAGRTLWTIPAVFGTYRAPQLVKAAEAAGLTVSEAKTELLATKMRVLTIGFAPGQPYLGTLGTSWNIPRQIELSPNVPAGALVAAVRQICLFTKDTPTGWHHIGQSAFKCFRPKSDVPFPLSPGDEVQFISISTRELAQIELHNPDGSGGALREVIT